MPRVKPEKSRIRRGVATVYSRSAGGASSPARPDAASAARSRTFWNNIRRSSARNELTRIGQNALQHESRQRATASSLSLIGRSATSRCPVCFEDLVGSTFMTHCGHAFHPECIATWLYRSGTHRCPVCREDILADTIADPRVEDSFQDIQNAAASADAAAFEASQNP